MGINGSIEAEAPFDEHFFGLVNVRALFWSFKIVIGNFCWWWLI